MSFVMGGMLPVVKPGTGSPSLRKPAGAGAPSTKSNRSASRAGSAVAQPRKIVKRPVGGTANKQVKSTTSRLGGSSRSTKKPENPRPRARPVPEPAVKASDPTAWDYSDLYPDWNSPLVPKAADNLQKDREKKRNDDKLGGVIKRQREHRDLTKKEAEAEAATQAVEKARAQRFPNSVQPVGRKKGTKSSSAGTPGKMRPSSKEPPTPPKISADKVVLFSAVKKVFGASPDPKPAPPKRKKSSLQVPSQRSKPAISRREPRQYSEPEDEEDDESEDSFFVDDRPKKRPRAGERGRDRDRDRDRARGRERDDRGEDYYEKNYRQEISQMFNRRRRYREDVYSEEESDGDDDEDTGFAALMEEEERSTRIAKREDDLEFQRDQARKRKKAKAKARLG